MHQRLHKARGHGLVSHGPNLPTYRLTNKTPARHSSFRTLCCEQKNQKGGRWPVAQRGFLTPPSRAANPSPRSRTSGLCEGPNVLTSMTQLTADSLAFRNATVRLMSDRPDPVRSCQRAVAHTCVPTNLVCNLKVIQLYGIQIFIS